MVEVFHTSYWYGVATNSMPASAIMYGSQTRGWADATVLGLDRVDSSTLTTPPGPLTGLALTVARAFQAGLARSAEASQAMAMLVPAIQGIARAQTLRMRLLRLQAAQDFVQDAPEHIWSKISRFAHWYHNRLPAESRADGTIDRFPAWCQRVLQRHLIDLARQQRRLPRIGELTGDEWRNFRLKAAGRAFSLDLEPHEWESLQDWDPMDGVILFLLAEQWDAVPAQIRSRWLVALGLAEPFPTPEFRAAPRKKRREILARSLGFSRDAIDQRLARLRARVRSARIRAAEARRIAC